MSITECAPGRSTASRGFKRGDYNIGFSISVFHPQVRHSAPRRSSPLGPRRHYIAGDGVECSKSSLRIIGGFMSVRGGPKDARDLPGATAVYRVARRPPTTGIAVALSLSRGTGRRYHVSHIQHIACVELPMAEHGNVLTCTVRAETCPFGDLAPVSHANMPAVLRYGQGARAYPGGDLPCDQGFAGLSTWCEKDPDLKIGFTGLNGRMTDGGSPPRSYTRRSLALVSPSPHSLPPTMSTANVSNASNQNEVQAILDDAFKKRAAAEAERDDLKQWLDLTKARLDSSESFVSSLQQSIEEHSGTARLRRHEVREVKKEFRCLFVEVRTALDDVPIPDTILLNISTYADGDTRLVVSSVNHALRTRLVPLMFKTIVVDQDDERSIKALGRGLLATARELVLHDTRLARELIPHATRSAPLRLQSLTFSPDSDDALYRETMAISCLLPFLRASPHLERLDCVLVLRRQRDLFALMSEVTGIKKLVIQHIEGPQREPLSGETAPWVRLEELIVGNGVTDAWFELVLRPHWHPPLTALDISKGADVTWTTLRACLGSVRSSIERLHISSSMLLENDDTEGAGLHFEGHLPALRELHVRMLTRRGDRLQEMDGVKNLIRVLSNDALAPITELHLEFFIMSVFYSDMGRGGGYRGGNNADVTGICGDRLTLSWWQSFALPRRCSMIILIIYDAEDEASDSESTDSSATDSDLDDGHRASQARYPSGLLRRPYGENEGLKWKPHARSLLLHLAQSIGVTARVSFAPGECPSSGWPEEWIEQFEEDPDKAMDENETALFYNWREWEV
ncbi:uncharacterized protein SCHCODRAFT_02516715 [Schizophyllum commune H4-8]|uniref:uncharacterized protein n=1 Tax=Schizophyllum commune (strain H4-8 / FGSC 9210) TaxID=578458 RepID=UPI00215EFE0A|nr:uncharacterized protein SCHCODRAFT_02516715 [Schizophyllum commune H4-8]KAI5887388.1 hypothetical protein SCHCODRAFT_02516715 [Schizophyllum commune H4-8]